MKYKAIPILILLFLPTFLSPVYAQPQMGKKAPGFLTSTLDGRRIALKDWTGIGGHSLGNALVLDAQKYNL